MRNFIALAIILGVSSTSYAERLSESELFYRCYSHITSKRVKRSHPILKAVKAGKISAVEGCIQVLSKARLTPQNKLSNTSDEESKSVLKNFTNLHMTFFEKQSISGVSTFLDRIGNDIYDDQGSALFYTKALFKDDDITNVLKGRNDLEGVRTRGRPGAKGYSSNIDASLFTYGSKGKKIPLPNVTFIETGDLIGLQNARTFIRPAGVNTRTGDKNLLNSIGGGLLGSRSYLQRSTSTANINYDGADKMNRVWANTVLKDFLCKSLPAARITDGQRYKMAAATSSFRKSDSCIQCHVTMDQLAAGGRGLRLANITIGNGSQTNPTFRHYYELAISQPNADMWPEKKDAFYYRRPPKGTLFYRSYDGKLLNKGFSNFTQLANNILETDDYYACVAKKYYQYFTGVSASLADINDPFSSVVLNKEDMFHRNKVIELGQNLKKSKSTYNLVKEIIKSDVYRQEGFTIMENK